MNEPPTGDATPRRPSLSDPVTRARYDAYWRRNLRYLAGLLVVWLVVSYGLGILLVERLNDFTIPGTGFPVGFWFAQQGSIYVFVVLIFVYAWLMNRLDREFDVDEGGEVGRDGDVPEPGEGSGRDGTMANGARPAGGPAGGSA